MLSSPRVAKAPVICWCARPLINRRCGRVCVKIVWGNCAFRNGYYANYLHDLSFFQYCTIIYSHTPSKLKPRIMHCVNYVSMLIFEEEKLQFNFISFKVTVEKPRSAGDGSSTDHSSAGTLIMEWLTAFFLTQRNPHRRTRACDA